VNPRAPIDKQAVREKILHHLRTTLELQRDAARSARDEAISDESRAENQYDTHSLEAGYLAEGQARQAAEINESIAIITALALPVLAPDAPVALGALCDVADSNGGVHSYFLCPRAGGLDVEVEGRKILVVTPQSPLGRALLGRRQGETVALPGRRDPGPSVIAGVS
jgi:transcription elongation GreA/GreB family factor